MKALLLNVALHCRLIYSEPARHCKGSMHVTAARAMRCVMCGAVAAAEFEHGRHSTVPAAHIDLLRLLVAVVTTAVAVAAPTLQHLYVGKVAG